MIFSTNDVVEKLSCLIGLQTICQITNSLWSYWIPSHTKCFQRLQWTWSVDYKNLRFTWIGSMTSVMSSVPASLLMLFVKFKSTTAYKTERWMCRLLLCIGCLPDTYSTLQPMNIVRSEKLYNEAASDFSQSIRENNIGQWFKKIP